MGMQTGPTCTHNLFVPMASAILRAMPSCTRQRKSRSFAFCLLAARRSFTFSTPTTAGPRRKDVIDVSQSIFRVPRLAEALPCICPRGLPWLRKRFLRAAPNECLQAQGISLRTASAVASFSDAELMSLAGNAFSAYTAMAMTIAGMSSFGFESLV